MHWMPFFWRWIYIFYSWDPSPALPTHPSYITWYFTYSCWSKSDYLRLEIRNCVPGILWFNNWQISLNINVQYRIQTLHNHWILVAYPPVVGVVPRIKTLCTCYSGCVEMILWDVWRSFIHGNHSLFLLNRIKSYIDAMKRTLKQRCGIAGS